MTDYLKIIEDFSNCKVLCIGDVMLDRFIYGQVDRISPEAPIPVFAIGHENSMLGGAGNVARNLVGLGAQVSFVSVVGNDKTAHKITSMIGKEEQISPFLITEIGRITTVKTRFVAGNHQILRADNEVKHDISVSTVRMVLDILASEVAKVDVVLISDYGKGLLTREVLQKIIEISHEHKKPVIVDPKSRDFSCYSGATLISPNLHELANAANCELKTDKEIIATASSLIARNNIENILVTRSKDGMSLVKKDGSTHHIKASAKEVFDVSGAGDTAIATLALGIAAKLELEEAANLANIAAGIVVGRIGTAVISAQDLETEFFAHETNAATRKIMLLASAKAQSEKWQRDGKVVAFTNGCFDLMHSGHLSLLNQIKANCDKLIVGVNSDASVKRLKGETRPINSELERALMLASLSVVDMVVIFGEDTPINLIETLRPNIIAKGADYAKTQVIGYEFVESYGGQVLLIPLKEGYSTTNIIKKVSA